MKITVERSILAKMMQNVLKVVATCLGSANEFVIRHSRMMQTIEATRFSIWANSTMQRFLSFTIDRSTKVTNSNNEKSTPSDINNT
jgi:hypothetical protein